MLKMVDGTGIIGADMICPLGVSTPQPPNYDKVEVEGTGILVLPNSLDAPLERLELGGKTEQVQTSGKNLFDIKTYREMNGCEIIDNNQISFVQNLAKINYEIELDAGDYLISFSRKKYSSITIRNGETVLHTNGGENNYSFHIKLSELATIGIEFASGQNPNSEQRIVYNIQLEKGATATPYEPYTGGKPSPSPEYPQEIKNSGKWNEETQKYEVDVKVTGKNLLNLQKEPDVKGLYQGWKVGNGDKGTLSIKDKGNNADISECYFGLNSDGTTSNSVTWLVDNGVIKRYHIESVEKMYACLFPPKETFIKKITERFEIQYEYGSIATEYQPYKEQLLTLTSDRPITKWDRLVEQGGEIGWLYGTKKYVVTGKENFTYGSENYYTGSRIDMFFEIRDATGNEAIMRDLSFVPSIWHLTDKEGFCINGKQLHIGLYNTRIVVSDDAAKEEKIKAYKEFMAKRYADGNPFEVYYKTTETEFIPLPQSEQNAIRALKTYYPTTVITADGGELDPDIKVTYRKEI